MKKKLLPFAICLGGNLFFSSTCLAARLPLPPDRIEIRRCIERAAEGRVWLERTLWGLRDQEGGWIGAQVLNNNGSHDLGVLQVNSGWVPRLALETGASPERVRSSLRFDPCFNAAAARWIFLSALRQTRDYWKAIGAYHSPTRWRQQRYASSVAGHLRARFGANVFIEQPGR